MWLLRVSISAKAASSSPLCANNCKHICSVAASTCNCWLGLCWHMLCGIKNSEQERLQVTKFFNSNSQLPAALDYWIATKVALSTMGMRLTDCISWHAILSWQVWCSVGMGHICATDHKQARGHQNESQVLLACLWESHAYKACHKVTVLIIVSNGFHILLYVLGHACSHPPGNICYHLQTSDCLYIGVKPSFASSFT